MQEHHLGRADADALKNVPVHHGEDHGLDELIDLLFAAADIPVSLNIAKSSTVETLFHSEDEENCYVHSFCPSILRFTG